MIKLARSTRCLLCNSKTDLFYQDKDKIYYRCRGCFSIILDPSNHVDDKEEKERYKLHNNNVKDLGYQRFVSPLVESVKANYKRDHMGLDYGAGTSPVAASLLEKEGYHIKLYDPYFHAYPENLYRKYDYIICSEVIEHFYNPYHEFKNLSKILNPSGSIICMTSLYEEDIDFKNWYYKNDKTHVFFYHRKALEWIKDEFDFSKLDIDGKLIKLSK